MNEAPQDPHEEILDLDPSFFASALFIKAFGPRRFTSFLPPLSQPCSLSETLKAPPFLYSHYL